MNQSMIIFPKGWTLYFESPPQGQLGHPSHALQKLLYAIVLSSFPPKN